MDSIKVTIKQVETARGVIDRKVIYAIPHAQNRAQKTNTSNERKRRNNANAAINKLADKANNNFADGYAVILTLSDTSLKGLLDDVNRLINNGCTDPEIALLKAMALYRKLFLKRLARHIPDKSLQYIIAPSTRDSRDCGQSPIRPHYHMMVSATNLKHVGKQLYVGDTPLESIWTYGFVPANPLRPGDLLDYIRYIIIQSPHFPHMQRYSCSRNLQLPKTIITPCYALPPLAKTPIGAQEICNEVCPNSSVYQHNRYFVLHRDQE